MLGDTVVGFPGWGAVGEVAVGMRYRDVQRDVGEKFDEAVEVLQSWTAALTTARVNWRTAEETAPSCTSEPVSVSRGRGS